MQIHLVQTYDFIYVLYIYISQSSGIIIIKKSEFPHFKEKHDSVVSSKYCTWEQLILAVLTGSAETLHTGLIKWQGFMNFIPTALLAGSEIDSCHASLSLKRNWPASLKLAKAQQPNHNTGMEACVLMPVLAFFHMCLHSIQDTCSRSSCCFLTFSQRSALHHWKCVICANTLKHANTSAKLWDE